MALVRFIKTDDAVNGLQADHSPSTDELDLLDLAFGGVFLGTAGAGVAGPSVLNDDSSIYSNISPAGDTLRDTLLAIDGAIGGQSSVICNSYTNANAGSIALGDAVYISAADSVDLADNDLSTTDDVIGVVGEASIAAAAAGVVCSEGVVAGAITGLGATAGAAIYLANGGVSGSTLTVTPPGQGSGDTVFLVGYAKSATDLHISRQFISRRSA